MGIANTIQKAGEKGTEAIECRNPITPPMNNSSYRNWFSTEKKELDRKVKLLYCFFMKDKTDLIKTIIGELLRISTLYQRIEEMPIPVNSQTEVSTREAHTIQVIGENRKMSVTRVADCFGITKSGASQMVKKLTQKGFLLKRQAAHSNKEFELSLTPLGWQAFQAHERHHGKDYKKLIKGLEPFSILQIATLSVVLESLGAIMENRICQRDKTDTDR